MKSRKHKKGKKRGHRNKGRRSGIVLARRAPHVIFVKNSGHRKKGKKRSHYLKKYRFRRNKLSARVPRLWPLAKNVGSVGAGLIGPTLLEGVLSSIVPLASPGAVLAMKAAAHLGVGIAGTFIFSRRNATLTWIGVGVSAAIALIKSRGISIPGLSAGDRGAGILPAGMMLDKNFIPIGMRSAGYPPTPVTVH